MAKKKPSNKKGSATPAPLTKADKRRIIQHASRLDREGPWILYRYRGDVSEKVLWDVADGCRALRIELKKPKAERNVDALATYAEAVDRDLERYFGKRRKSSLRQSTEAVVVALAVAMFIRLFIFEPYRIPSGSMIPTLRVHDFLFVSKFTYGIQLPYTDFTFFDWRQPKRGEIIIFEHPLPEENDEILIKRVVAVAGDTVRLTGNIWMVNDKPLGNPEVITRTGQCRLSPGETCTWRPVPYVEGEPAKPGCPCTFQHESSESHDWVTQHVSEDVVCECTPPEGEDATSLDGRRVLQQHLNSAFWPARDPFFPRGWAFLKHWPEGHRESSVSTSDDGFPQVTIPEGYIMVMGDNRDSSSDGRFWGLVPLNKVRGKASFIWFATENPLGRIFRRVH